jgi:lantibiotic biosynthesis protein
MTAKKPHLKLMDTIICRTPVFGIEDDLQSRWPELKELIQESSPEFHRVIAESEAEDMANANDKAAFSVWKYFNRARFRSTPFGNFAAISFAQVKTNHNCAEPLRINSRMISHRFTDWSEKDEHMQSVKRVLRSSTWFQSNATYYIVGDQLRYIRHSNDQFELATVVVFDELKQLLTTCREKQNKQTIHELMYSTFGMKPSAVDNMLCQLIECQLLLTDQMPNIIGADHFERLLLPQKNSLKQYIIAERELNDGQPGTSLLCNIPEYLDFISGFLPKPQNANFESFKREFSSKFDMRAIPLSIALDPETGIGYGDMAHDPEGSELTGILADMKKKEAGSPVFDYTPQYRFLLNALIKGGDIRLENFEGDENKNHFALPNTLSVMYQTWNNMPVLQNAGGCTANYLLGRFTLGCEKAEEFARRVVATEETANPDVLFFDIAYQAEKQVDNVNRRKQIYNYELPILSWPCGGAALSTEDILVMLRNDEIILWSKQYNKRIVPRVASAYNYTRSDLAIYRFLCDLQHQQLSSSLTFDIRQVFPGLDHYPRVLYKNIVVSPAMWKIGTKAISSGDKEKDMERLTSWLRSNNITGRFKCGNSDQTLCFDSENSQDMAAFITWGRQNNEKDTYIQEALIDETSFIADENARSYLPQYIAGYFHNERVYRPLSSYSYGIFVRDEAIPGDFLPGNEWLYFEIYSHPLRANIILEQHINPLIQSLKKHLHKWFFIRYADPKSHIRLRFKVKDTAMIDQLMISIKNVLQPLYEGGFIADIQVKTYHREIERYGQYRIDNVERFFYQDSKYALRLLLKDHSIDQLYQLTLKIMNRLFSLAFEDVNQRLDVIKVIADNFSNEFAVNNEGYKAINKSFETLKNDKANYLPAISEAALKQYDTAFCNVLNDCNENEKINMVADLVHMHVNRIFAADQRMHEAILYQYLLKLARSRKHLAVAEPVLL